MTVEKYSGVGQAFGNSTVVGTTHVHGHGFEFSDLPGEHLQERLHILLLFTLYGMKYSSFPQISKDGHVIVPLTDTELVNAEILDIVQEYFSEKAVQMGLVNTFNHIPGDVKIVSDRLNLTKMEKIRDCQGK